MQRREFLQSGLLLGTVGLLPGVELTTSGLFGDTVQSTNLRLPHPSNVEEMKRFMEYIKDNNVGRLKYIIPLTPMDE